MVNENLLSFLEQSWLFVFIISIIFVFIIIFRDLGQTTRRIHRWVRSSYNKTFPRVSLTFQHFSRRGELLSVTNLTLCQNVRGDLIKYLKLIKGYSDKDLKSLLADKIELLRIFKDESVVNFIYDLNSWLESISPEISGFRKLTKRIRSFFSEERELDNEFFIELALVISNFRKALETK